MGFGHLLGITLNKLPRDLCLELIHAYDPPSKQITIRGKTKKVTCTDVRRVLGLPDKGSKVKLDGFKDEVNELKKDYTPLTYSQIAEKIKSDEEDGNFEFYFVLFTVGTLLCPTGSASVSDKVLKVMACTENNWKKFDWASFVLDKLSEEIKRYNRSSKEGQTESARVVGECIYFLLLHFLQRFPLQGGEPKDKDVVRHWDDKAVKRRIDAEKESRHGIFYSPPAAEVNESTQPGSSTSFHHPVSNTNVIMSVARRRRRRREEDEDENDNVREDEAADKDTEDEQAAQTEEGKMVGKAVQLPTRRSSRRKVLVVKSPYMSTYGRKVKMSDRDAFYTVCTEVMVDMFGHLATRSDLQVLGPRRWISNRIMTLIAHTLNADQHESASAVKRHIFDADFTARMVQQHTAWQVDKHLKELLPQHVGYNLAECEYIFAPVVFALHWFCFVFEPSTLKFYVLDSLRGGEDTMKHQKKKNKSDPALKGQQIMAQTFRAHFIEILRRVKPELEGLANPDSNNDILYPTVHVQDNTDDCGVHVITYLREWPNHKRRMEFYSPCLIIQQ
ncbi:uncharacterized protein LOC114750156 [Neltuma alba]|uniref:uncharacterized protein LOC114750156 n=1 Tax=Neltuma alba TaxID=207710 RepID=UPI0010A42445|nr:uncharacterized protein LOC114750156 [Prosopis alba]